jgi:predicted PurR-regulated permease PerM
MAPAGVRPATTPEKVAWLLAAAGLLFVFWFHLVPGLVAGLFVNSLLHRLARRMTGRWLTDRRAKVVAAVAAGLVAIGVGTAIVLGLIAFSHGHVGNLPALFAKMAEVLDDTREWLEAHGWGAVLPETLRDAEAVNATVTDWLRTHGAQLRKTGGELGRALLHAAFGMAIGVLVFFRHPSPAAGPLGRALAERLRRLEQAFEAVVFAQVKISAVNTTLTALYLLVALPLAGVHLPFRGTLVAVTFLAGLLPVVGNLISNTAIVVISLGVSVWVALASLVFLVVIHKLEYFINARIVGGEIHASAWELLIALMAFESAFGVPGLVLAPILYAWIKGELLDRGLV